MTEQTIKNINEKPNSFSFRYGKTGTDVKLYFDDATDLGSQLDDFARLSESYKKNLEAIKEAMAENE